MLGIQRSAAASQQDNVSAGGIFRPQRLARLEAVAWDKCRNLRGRWETGANRYLVCPISWLQAGMAWTTPQP